MKLLLSRRILVLEDEYFLATELKRILDIEGAIVIGPMSALEQVKHVPLEQIDAAVLNVRVRDGISYQLAKQLGQRGIPFVFASGQDRGTEPSVWHEQEWVEKPYEAPQLIEALVRTLSKRARS